MARRTPPVTRLLGLALALGLAAGTAACGEKEPEAGTKASSTTTSSPKPSATPTPPATPACTAVWVAGKVFPDPYTGCLHQDKKVSFEPIRCETGQEVFRHLDRFYATPGAPIRRTKGPLKDDPKYQKMYRACTA